MQRAVSGAHVTRSSQGRSGVQVLLLLTRRQPPQGTVCHVAAHTSLRLSAQAYTEKDLKKPILVALLARAGLVYQPRLAPSQAHSQGRHCKVVSWSLGLSALGSCVGVQELLLMNLSNVLLLCAS